MKGLDASWRGAERAIVTVELTDVGRPVVVEALAHRHARLAAVLDQMSWEDRAAAVRVANEFTRLSGGDAIALGATGPVPL